MLLHFTKMEGCGNDYVYINGVTEHVPEADKPALVRRLSDRHFGIGSDGVIWINPVKDQTVQSGKDNGAHADFEMEMWNADGTRAEMCGNGIRCVAKYVYDHAMTRDFADPSANDSDRMRHVDIVSAGVVHPIDLYCRGDKACKAKVNMGRPILNAPDIPVQAEKSPIVSAPFTVGGKEYALTCVSMGNPHAVLFVDDTSALDLPKIGPLFENNGRFPKRTNTEFVQVLDRSHVRMRVWERGAGETLACGTGCCATAVACVLNGKTERKITVDVLGGSLEIEWNEETDEVFMTGPAKTVFEGTVEI